MTRPVQRLTPTQEAVKAVRCQNRARPPRLVRLGVATAVALALAGCGQSSWQEGWEGPTTPTTEAQPVEEHEPTALALASETTAAHSTEAPATTASPTADAHVADPHAATTAAHAVTTTAGHGAAPPKALALVSDSHGTTATTALWSATAPSTTAAAGHAAAPGAAAHWSYSGQNDPEHWAELDPANIACAQGRAQTPIDIANPTPIGLDDPIFAYVLGGATVINNGHTIQANAAPGSALRIDGTVYALAQIHFHAPSEHAVNGLRAPVEVHFVHKSANGQLAVVGVMLVAGTANTAWDPYVGALTVTEGTTVEITLDWKAMLPKTGATIRYIGSLTTPPCSEGVSWLVLSDPVRGSPAQIKAFEAAYSGTIRPLQPQNGRTVVIDATPGFH